MKHINQMVTVGRAFYSQGMTLIEALTSLALAAVLLGIAVPAFDALLSSSRLSSASNGFFTSLFLARSESIKRNARVVMCISADGETCSATGYWDQGWVVFHDADNDAQVDAGEAIITHVNSLPNNISIRGNTPVSKYVSYSPQGNSKLIGGGFQAGTVTICQVSATTTESRNIVISATGRPRVQKSTVASCTL
jgi:type IV fimbrial biogenesis protein FimT